MASKKQSATKRILSEAKELAEAQGAEGIVAAPLEDDMYTFHYTLAGPPGTPFEGGVYHGKVLLPTGYPFEPPDMVWLTPNGRWETDRKICLTFTGYHTESWQPAWGLRTALLGVQALMGTDDAGSVGLGAIRPPEAERRRLARLSREWTCDVCKKSNHTLLEEAQRSADPATAQPEPQAPPTVLVSFGSSSATYDPPRALETVLPDVPSSLAPDDGPTPASILVSTDQGGESAPEPGPLPSSVAAAASSSSSSAPSLPLEPAPRILTPAPAPASASGPSPEPGTSPAPVGTPPTAPSLRARHDPPAETLPAPDSSATAAPEGGGEAEPSATFLEIRLLEQRARDLQQKRVRLEGVLFVLVFALAVLLLRSLADVTDPLESGDDGGIREHRDGQPGLTGPPAYPFEDAIRLHLAGDW